MTPLLRWVIVGRYKSFEGRTFDDGSNGGKCIIHMPFPAIASAAAAGAHAWQPRRTLLFFAGAVDGVCCVGARVRCAVAELWGRTHGRPEYADVVIRPSQWQCAAAVPRQGTPHPFKRAAVDARGGGGCHPAVGRRCYLHILGCESDASDCDAYRRGVRVVGLLPRASWRHVRLVASELRARRRLHPRPAVRRVGWRFSGRCSLR